MTIVFYIIVLIFAVVLHEVSHGAVANAMGDPTAKYQGRLTLNPIKHLDLYGSFLLPLFLLLISGGRFVFGWAKPVPYNPYNLKNQKWGPALVALAGPATNFLVAIFFGLAIRFFYFYNATGLSPVFVFFNIIVLVNLTLGIFNLVPIPPLDGSKILYAVMPYSWRSARIFLERYGLLILLLFLFFGFQFLTPLIALAYNLLVGKTALLI